MHYWLLKSEPSSYAWDDLLRDGGAVWDGVRNHQAANNLKAMQTGDRAFFYHSGAAREIAGVAAIVRPAFPDPSDRTGRFVAVELAPLAAAGIPVTLARIRAEPRLKGMALLHQPRLSVSPVTGAEWTALCGLAGLKP